MMTIVEYVLPLGEDVRKRHWHRAEAGKVVDFVVQLEVFVAGEWKPVVRYDYSHKFCHIDIYNLKGRKMKRATLFVMALALCMAAEVTKADFVFGEPVNLGPTINTSYSDAIGGISGDGLELYVASGRPPATESNWDTWLSTRTTTEDAWGQPVRMEAPLNTSYDDGAVFISSDGLELYLYSQRPGGSGSSDIWVAKRESRDGSWNSVVNLGPIINSPSYEWVVSMSADGLELYFDSDRSGGFGGFDLYVATRTTKDEDWGSPVNLGPKVNSSSNEFAPYLSSDGRYLFFSDYSNN